MSITSIMNSGLSGLSANQQALKATSTNVANVNTEGYSRLSAQFSAVHLSGSVEGVGVDIQRIASAFLAAAEYRGAGDVGSAEVLAAFVDRAQELFGDPSDPGSLFATLDPVISGFGELALDPSSNLRSGAVISELQTMLGRLEATQREVSALRDEAHLQGQGLIAEVNTLLSSIAALNATVQSATIGGASSAAGETEQAVLLGRLAEIIDIRVTQRQLGGIDVRTSDGILLVDNQAAVLAYDSTSDGEAYPGLVVTSPRSSTEVAFGPHLGGGELIGAIRARDSELVNISKALGEFAGGIASALNAAHNSTSAVPAPAALTGQNTGLLVTDTLNFSGATNIGVVDSDGVLQRNLRVDFTALTITDDLGTVTAFANSVGDFQTALNTVLQTSPGVNGQATFSNGVLSLSTSNAGGGLVITDDPTSPARRSGKGFSQAFGLNDLITKSTPLNYDTGLNAGDLHGFGATETLTFAFRNSDGVILRTSEMTVGPGAQMADLLVSMNTNLAGYAQATLSSTGRITITSQSAQFTNVDVIADTTSRGDTNLSLSGLFGLGDQIPSDRANNLGVRKDIAADTSKLGTAQAALVGTVIGTRVLSPGDGSGALLLEAAGSAKTTFSKAGSVVGGSLSITEYAARLGGQLSLRAQALESAAVAASSVLEKVSERRSNEEGVNLDEELVNLTTYQQAYSASSRVIQAARDLYDILLNMV